MWKDLAEEKRSRLDKAIPEEWRITAKPTGLSVMEYPRQSGILSAVELAITESSAADLVQRMANGELTSVAVTLAFCKRAALAQQLVRNHPGEHGRLSL